MENRETTHCTDKNAHWMCIMWHGLYNILQQKLQTKILLQDPKAKENKRPQNLKVSRINI